MLKRSSRGGQRSRRLPATHGRRQARWGRTEAWTVKAQARRAERASKV